MNPVADKFAVPITNRFQILTDEISLKEVTLDVKIKVVFLSRPESLTGKTNP